MAMSGKVECRVTEGRIIGSVLCLFVCLFVGFIAFAMNLIDSAAGRKLYGTVGPT